VHGPEELAQVAAGLNGRPRKTLDWKTPAEARAGLLSAAAHEPVLRRPDESAEKVRP